MIMLFSTNFRSDTTENVRRLQTIFDIRHSSCLTFKFDNVRDFDELVMSKVSASRKKKSVPVVAILAQG